MPFQSEKQRRYLWANEPEIARDWTDTYGSGIAKALGGRIPFAEGSGKTSIVERNLANKKAELEFYPDTPENEEKRAEIQADIDRLEGDIGTGADTLLGSGEAPTEGFWGKLSELLGMSQAEGGGGGGGEDGRDPLVYDEEKGYDVRDLQAHGLAGIYPHAWDNKPTLEGDPFYVDGEFQTFQQPTHWNLSESPYQGVTQTGYETLGYNELGNPLQDFRSNVRSPSGVQLSYKTPRTIADQNRVLGRTFTDADTPSNWLANLRKYTMPAYNFARGNIGAGLMGLVQNMNPMAALAMFAGGKNLKDSRFYKPATQGAYGYNPAQLNQMNALGGYYSEPARQQRRTESRIKNLLARKAAGKSYSQKNLNTLTMNQGPAGITPKAPRGPVGPPPGGGPHGNGGGGGGGGIGSTASQRGPAGGSVGASRFRSRGGRLYNRGGLAALWQR